MSVHFIFLRQRNTPVSYATSIFAVKDETERDGSWKRRKRKHELLIFLVLSSTYVHLARRGGGSGMWAKHWSHKEFLHVSLRHGKHSWAHHTWSKSTVCCANECDTRQQWRKMRTGGKERVGLVLRWLVWWVGDRESWSITYRLPIASVRGVVGKGGLLRERIGRESVLAWLLKILYTADDK